jgi:nitrous oxidase accessory protein
MTISIVAAAALFTVHAVGAEIAVAPAPGALAAAIAAAEAGDTLMLSPGRYDGPVTLTKTLSLVGREGATVSAGGKGSVITVDAPDGRIEGLIIENSGRSGVDLDAGVKLTARAQRARVERNIFNNNLVGVDVHGAAGAHIVGNEINGLLSARMNDRGNGVYVWNAPGAAIADNRISGGRDGIFLNSSRENLIAGNTMKNLRFAIHYMYTLDSRIVDNVSTGNHLGFALMFSSGLVVAGNRSIGDRDHGVMLNFVNSSEIRANDVTGGAEKCLFIYNANKNAISRNRFEGCGIGVHFTAGSAGNALFENAFIANRMQVKYVGSTTHEWSLNGVGNYWSDLAAYDINGDGVADQPFRPNGAMDQILWTQPAARLLFGSPAFQIIRWAQSSFPSLLPGGVIDSAPLMLPVVAADKPAQGGAGLE